MNFQLIIKIFIHNIILNLPIFKTFLIIFIIAMKILLQQVKYRKNN